VGERDHVQVVVLADGQPRLDRGRGLLGTLGKHITGVQQRERGRHDLASGQPLSGQRATSRIMIGGVTALVLWKANSSSQAGGEPQCEFPPDLLHLVLWVSSHPARASGESSGWFGAGRNMRPSSWHGSMTGSSRCCSSATRCTGSRGYRVFMSWSATRSSWSGSARCSAPSSPR